MEELNRIIENLHKEIELLEDANKELTWELDKANTHLNDLEEELQEANMIIETIDVDRDLLDNEIRELRDALEESHDELESEREELELAYEEQNRLNETICILQTAIENLQEEVEGE